METFYLVDPKWGSIGINILILTYRFIIMLETELTVGVKKQTHQILQGVSAVVTTGLRITTRIPLRLRMRITAGGLVLSLYNRRLYKASDCCTLTAPPKGG